MTHLSSNFPSRYSSMYVFTIAERNTKKKINSIANTFLLAYNCWRWRWLIPTDKRNTEDFTSRTNLKICEPDKKTCEERSRTHLKSDVPKTCDQEQISASGSLLSRTTKKEYNRRGRTIKNQSTNRIWTQEHSFTSGWLIPADCNNEKNV